MDRFVATLLLMHSRVLSLRARLGGRGNPSEIQLDGRVASLLAMTKPCSLPSPCKRSGLVCPLAMTTERRSHSRHPVYPAAGCQSPAWRSQLAPFVPHCGQFSEHE